MSKLIEIDGVELWDDETIFYTTSALGCEMARGVIFIKEIPHLITFRNSTKSTEVFIYHRKFKKYYRADEYPLENGDVRSNYEKYEDSDE